MSERETVEETGKAPPAGAGSLAERASLAVVTACVAFVVAMVGMAYAAAPLYQVFCGSTGCDAAPRRIAAASQAAADRKVPVRRFEADTASGLPSDFAPVQDEVVVRLGGMAGVTCRVGNPSDRIAHAQATLDVPRAAAGAFVGKVGTFCFARSTLGPGETAEPPVVFLVDPACVDAGEPKHVRTPTLSCAFFAVENVSPSAAGAGNGRI